MLSVSIRVSTGYFQLMVKGEGRLNPYGIDLEGRRSFQVPIHTVRTREEPCNHPGVRAGLEKLLILV